MHKIVPIIIFALFGISCSSKNVGSLDSIQAPPLELKSVRKAETPSKPVILTTKSLRNITLEKPAFTISGTLFDSEIARDLDERLLAVFLKFDIPITHTPRVQHYMDYFTGTGRSYMQSWIDRSNKYMHIARDIFSREGVPLDLVMLSFTESGFNPLAYSRAGAAGMWQFMPSTGRLYGLQVNEWVDERRDFEKSTTAAAKHLRDLYELFGDWYLALAAYNAGSGRIKRATQIHKSKDFFTIAGTRTLKLETRDYVPKYLAQLLIYKNLTEYGFTPPRELPILFDAVDITKSANLVVIAGALSVQLEDLKLLNPELRTPITPSPYKLRVPLGKGAELAAFMDNPASDPVRYTIYRARAGESLENIAAAHNTTVQAIKSVNSLNFPRVYTEKLIFIPRQKGFSDLDRAFAKEVQNLAPKYYTVRKGDNLSTISRRYNMPLVALKQLNPKVNPRRLYPGQVLVISRGGLIS